jgi:serine/threonine protein phosphatase PrpC
MTPAAPRFVSAATSETGLVRPNNEDRVYRDDEHGIFLVVDGMGGQRAGEKAAELAVEHIRLRLLRQTGGVEQRVREAIALANNAIYEAAQSRPDWAGMACVLTCAVIRDGEVTIGHVGDSRLYRIRRGSIEKVTHDHSPIGEREDQGELSESEAMAHPRRNEVYRDVGSEPRTPDDEGFIEILKIPFEPDSALLLCSDGLSDAISSAEILETVQRFGGDHASAVRALVDSASRRGQDNISAVLVEGEAFAASLKIPSLQPRRAAPPTPAGEDTARMGGRSSVPWYARPSIWLACGLALGLAAGLMAGWFAHQSFTQVPQRLTVIQPATIVGELKKARPGDTVVVAPGTYAEAVELPDGVVLISEKPLEAVISGRVTANGVQNARIEGFSIRGGVQLLNSDVLLVRNDLSDGAGAGLVISGNSRGAVIGCSIHNNVGPGIVINGTAMPVIEHNSIWANGMANPRTPAPGLLLETAVRPRVEANVFGSNGAEPIWAPLPDESLVARNYFSTPPNDRRPRLRPAREREPGRAPR